MAKDTPAGVNNSGRERGRRWETATALHAVSNNIRIIFGIFSKLSHDPQSSLSPLQVPPTKARQREPAGMKKPPG
jgi:hypothetical protein